MDIILIQLYVLVCQTYDNHSDTCFQRLSNNKQPDFTDQELVTIYLFGHLNRHREKKAIHEFIKNYWADWFPTLPSYQTFCYRLNLLEQTFQTIGGVWFDLLKQDFPTENDHLIDSMPIMLAKNGHAYTARVARDISDVGYCSAKKTYFHGLRLHSIAARRFSALPTEARNLVQRGFDTRFTKCPGAGNLFAKHHSTNKLTDSAYPCFFQPSFQAL